MPGDVMEKRYTGLLTKESTASRRTWRLPFRIVEWLFIAALCVEVTCFSIVTVSNYILYGSPREGGGVRYDPYALFLNREGPKPTAHPFSPPESSETRRLWLFGGSTMRGETEDSGKTIPGFLARMLNREGKEVFCRVSNFGENSFNSLLEVKYLQKLLIENGPRPDLILFYDGANDCVYLTQHRDPSGHYGYRRLTALVNSYDRSLFGLLKPLNAAIYASFTRELYDKIMQTLVPVGEERGLIEQFLGELERRYDHVHALAQAMGSRFVLVLQPIWWVEGAGVSPEVKGREASIMKRASRFAGARESFNTIYSAIQERLRGKPYFADLRDVLISRGEPVYMQDGVHLNDKGREMVATALVRVLEERGGLSQDKPAR
jgi:hypothetical protein